MLFDTVCIVGVGLIGGSFGMTARERGLARRVIGAARRAETIELALAKGVIDEGSLDLEMAAAQADLIFMAPPVGQMASLCERIGAVARPGAIVTDAGSTKADIVRDCAPLFPAPSCFVGGHPMAGSERTGVEAARGDLFAGAVWVLTPTAETPPEVTAKLVAMVEATGALPLIMNPDAHDAVLAVTSHLPHVTASALVHLFARTRDEAAVAEQLIAGGWRDSTRIAAGSAELWRDISLANAPALTQSLDELISQLELVRRLLIEANGDALLQWFQQAAEVRLAQNCPRPLR